MTPLNATEDDALNYLYGGGDEVIECHSAAWVTTRFPQSCWSISHKGCHTLPAKTRMIVERAKIDGKFASCYTCEACIEATIKELSANFEKLAKAVLRAGNPKKQPKKAAKSRKKHGSDKG